MLSILMLFTILTYSQSLESLHDISIPTPKNAEFNKSVDVPISFYTGKASIGVPVYSVKSGDIEVPISLQYDSGGIKVNQISTRVGLGWNLKAGGMISRVQRLKSDEIGYLKEDFSQVIDSYLKGDNKLAKELNNRFIYEFNKGYVLDVVPDVFNFSFPGHSGKFFIDQKTKKVVLQSFSDLKIDIHGISNGRITSFLITNSKGIKFYFGVSKDKKRRAYDSMKNTRYTKKSEKNGVSDAGSNSRNSTYQNWMLLDVVDTRGNKVSFNYDVERVEYVERIKDRPYFVSKEGGNGVTGELDFYTLKGQSVVDEMYLKEITFNEGKNKVLFILSKNNRQDIIRGKAIDKIEVHAKENLLKGYILNHTYRESQDNVENVNSIYIGKGIKRMFLTSVNEFSKRESKPAYQFFYNVNKLPSRFSNSIDSWGYYNGSNNGKYLPYVLNSNSSNSFFKYGRNVDVNKSKAGVLERIKYPTGGETVLSYENNSVKTPKFMSKILTGYTNDIETKHIYFHENDKYKKSVKVYESEVFEIKRSSLTEATKYEITVRNEGCGIKNRESGCKFSIALYKLNEDNSETLYSHYPLAYIRKIGYIKPGKYKFKASRIANKESPFSEFNLDFMYGEEKVQEDEMLIGGLRIKEVVFKDGANEVGKTSYNYLSEKKESSGRLFSFPYFRSANNNKKFEGISKNFFALDNLSLVFLESYLSGNNYGYERVTEVKHNTKGNSKTIYNYSSVPDIGAFWTFPYPIPMDNSWLRGKLTKKEMYRSFLNGTEKKVYESEINYLIPDYILGESFKKNGIQGYNTLGQPIYEGITTPTSSDLRRIKKNNSKTEYIQPFFNFGNFIDRDPTIVFSYVNGGVSKVVNTKEINHFKLQKMNSETNYFYDYNNHYQLKRTEVINSQGETLKTEYTYPLSGTRLHNENRIIPIKIESFKGSSKLSTQNSVYTNFGSNHLPQKIQTFKGTLPPEDRIVYHKYDAKGNPVEVSKQDGTHIVYLWGYNYTQPIAKIENATYAQVMDALGKINTETLSYLQSYTEESQIQTEIQKIRSAISTAQVTTITYIPLVGVSIITDPRGEKITYHYDNFNRLKFVKDTQGNILKENKYNYKN